MGLGRGDGSRASRAVEWIAHVIGDCNSLPYMCKLTVTDVISRYGTGGSYIEVVYFPYNIYTPQSNMDYVTSTLGLSY